MLAFARRLGPLAPSLSPSFGVRVGLRAFAAKRDPERPVRPMSPFLLFCQGLRAQGGSVPAKDLVRQAAVQWKGMDEPQRSPYVQKYQGSLEAHQNAMAQYRSSGKAAAWKRDPERPKKALTPYMRYMGKFRKSPAAQGLRVTEVVKRGAASWKQLPASERAEFDAAYAQESQAYDLAVEAYKASGKEAAWKEKVGPTKKELEKEKAGKEAAKAKEAKAREALKARTAKARAAEAAAKERARAKAAKAREAEKLQAAKTKEKAAKAKEAEKAAAARQKEREAAKRARDREREASQRAKAKAKGSGKAKARA